MPALEIDAEDQRLIEAAGDALSRNFHPVRHTVGAAVVCRSGKIYTGVNIESCGYGPCAEPIALGAALTNGEREILAVVAVAQEGGGVAVLSPCGNCRQLLLDYTPEAMVIYNDGGRVLKARAKDLLPGAYRNLDEG